MPNQLASHGDNTTSPLHGILDIWSILRRRKGIILFGMTLGVALGVLAILKAPEKWESKAQIQIIRHDPNLPTSGTEVTTYSDSKKMEDELANQMKVMVSYQIIHDGLEKAGLLELESIVKELDLEDPNESVVSGVISYVIDNLYLSTQGEEENIAVKGGHWIYATFKHTDKEDTAKVLQAIVDEYQSFVEETYKSPHTDAANLLSNFKDGIETELTTLQKQYSEFVEKSPLLSSTEGAINVHLNSLNDYETQLRAILFQKLSTESRLEIIKDSIKPENQNKFSDLQRLALVDANHVERLGLLLSVENLEHSLVSTATTSESFQAEQPLRAETANAEFDKLVSLRMEVKNLQQEFGPKHPKVIDAQESLSDLEAFLVTSKEAVSEPTTLPDALQPNELVIAYIGLLEKDLEDLNRQEEIIKKFRDLSETSAKEVATFELREKLMREELERKQVLFQESLTRFSDISLLKDYRIFDTISMGNIANVNDAKLSLLFGIVPGGMLGFVFGLVLALVIDLADSTFRSPEQVRNALHAPVLAHIPRLNVRRFKRKAKKNSNISPVLVTYHLPQSPEAEIFRSLRTSLYFGGQGRSPKVVQVTSPNPKDGKSVTTSNLAISLAQSGKSVLLIDCDMRLPMVDKLFGLEMETGLSNVLRGEIDIPDAVQETGIPGLQALVCGPVPPNPAELLNQDTFTSLLEVVREQYDYVLIDSPPLLVVSDSSAVAPRVDTVILNIRLKKNGRAEAIRAKEILADVDANVLGVTMTGHDTQAARYYGSQSYATYTSKGSQSYYTTYKSDSDLVEV